MDFYFKIKNTNTTIPAKLNILILDDDPQRADTDITHILTYINKFINKSPRIKGWKKSCITSVPTFETRPYSAPTLSSILDELSASGASNTLFSSYILQPKLGRSTRENTVQDNGCNSNFTNINQLVDYFFAEDENFPFDAILVDLSWNCDTQDGRKHFIDPVFRRLNDSIEHQSKQSFTKKWIIVMSATESNKEVLEKGYFGFPTENYIHRGTAKVWEEFSKKLTDRLENKISSCLFSKHHGMTRPYYRAFNSISADKIFHDDPKLGNKEKLCLLEKCQPTVVGLLSLMRSTPNFAINWESQISDISTIIDCIERERMPSSESSNPPMFKTQLQTLKGTKFRVDLSQIHEDLKSKISMDSKYNSYDILNTAHHDNWSLSKLIFECIKLKPCDIDIDEAYVPNANSKQEIYLPRIALYKDISRFFIDGKFWNLRPIKIALQIVSMDMENMGDSKASKHALLVKWSGDSLSVDSLLKGQVGFFRVFANHKWVEYFFDLVYLKDCDGNQTDIIIAHHRIWHIATDADPFINQRVHVAFRKTADEYTNCLAFIFESYQDAQNFEVQK